MKTTIEVATPLFRRAQLLSRKRKTTMRALIEEGVSLVICAYTQQSETPSVVITPHVFGGPEKNATTWSEISAVLEADEFKSLDK